MIKKIFIITTLIFFTASGFLSAQPLTERFEKLELNNNGASLNQTYCMLQDHKGFLWFGTMYGLVKYNGRTYKIFKNDPADSTSISFDDIISLYEDKSGNIWIGTWGGGLNELNPETEKFKRFNFVPSKTNGISDNIIWSITQDSKGSIWLGTQSAGLDRYDPAENTFTNFKANPQIPNGLLDNTVRTLYCDNSGTIWAGTNGGLSKYLPDENKFYTYINDPNSSNSISSNVVFAIYGSGDGNLWVGTANGLDFYNEKLHTFSVFNKEKNSLSSNRVLSITEDIHGNVWAGTSHGLNRLKVGSKTFENFYQTNKPGSIWGNNIIALLADISGVIWIDAYQNGINKFVNTEDKFGTAVSALIGKKVSSFDEDGKGNIWIGTFDGELNRFYPGNGKINDYSLPPGNNQSSRNNGITCLKINKNDLWVGTRNGLENFDLTAHRFSSITNISGKLQPLTSLDITSILIDKLNQIWFGTYDRGIFIFNAFKNELKHFSYHDSSFASRQNNFILSMYMDSFGQIWVGTYGGLMRFDDVGEKIEFYSQEIGDPKSLSNNYVYSIYQDKAGEMWIGTANGLNLFNDSKKEFVHFFKKDGLPNSVITSILEDEHGKLWIGTNKGLSQFSPKINSFRNFSTTDGLQSDIFYPNSSLKTKDGYLYFGGINGFNYFHPDSLKFSTFVPILAITSFYFENKKSRRSELINYSNIELNHSDNTIHIEFSALDYANPGNIKYAYYLDGLESTWNPAGFKNSVTYNDLPPGDYKFKVKSTNSDGLWTSSILEVRIDILPPFWITWWFISIVFLIIIALIYFLYNFQLKYKVKRAVEIEIIREQENEKVRKKTAADFHDELGHILTRITILTELVKDKIKSRQSDVMPMLEKISENSRVLYDGTKDFIWAIDPHKDSFYELMIRLKDFGDDLFSTTDIQFQVNGIIEELKEIPLNMDWKRQLALIFKEGMNNSLKHAHGRQVFLEASILDQELEITLVDDGRGFNPKEHFNQNNGLENMKRRAEKISGILEFDSRKGIGTKISFRGRIAKNIVTA